MKKTFTSQQIDALREIVSIGAGNAATGLSLMVKKRIDISMTNVQVMPLEKIFEVLGKEEKLVSAVYITLIGELSGSILLIWPVSQALKLGYMLTGRKISTAKGMDEISRSSLKELTNITIGSYLGALSQVIKMKIMHSIPAFTMDMLGTILDEILIKLSLKAEKAVVIETKFIVDRGQVEGFLLFLLDPGALEIIFKRLGLWKRKK